MKRREFLRVLGGAAAVLPAAARGQQSMLPVIGYLSSRSPADSGHIIAAFQKGLAEMGLRADQNARIESRFAEGKIDRLPSLATELVNYPVNVLAATGGTSSVLGAKPVVPASLPLLFAMGGDPVKLGVVPSLARPGGNLTGIAFLVNGLAAKHTQLLSELAPNVRTIGFLANPKDPNFETDSRETQDAANVLGLRLVVVKATTERDLEDAFAILNREGARALFVQVGPVTTDLRTTIASRAAANKLPAIYGLREFVDAGGLISYGTSITDANRQLGVYTAQVLKGTKPADLPVLQSTAFELVINLKAAKAIGLEVPPTLLARADEVVE
jgi:putative ABC transport system substrate-binding protein